MLDLSLIIQVKERLNFYKQQIRQLQYQQLAAEEHLRTCGDGKFPFFKNLPENKPLRKSRGLFRR